MVVVATVVAAATAVALAEAGVSFLAGTSRDIRR